MAHPSRNSWPNAVFGRQTKWCILMDLRRAARTVPLIGAARRPAFAVSRPTPRLLRHRHPTSKYENHRAALPFRGGDFSLPRSEFRTAEASREKRQSMGSGSCCESRAETAPARFRSHLEMSQLLKGCSYSGRSSDTARTHDCPSNWNLSAE